MRTLTLMLIALMTAPTGVLAQTAPVAAQRAQSIRWDDLPFVPRGTPLRMTFPTGQEATGVRVRMPSQGPARAAP